MSDDRVACITENTYSTVQYKLDTAPTLTAVQHKLHVVIKYC